MIARESAAVLYAIRGILLAGAALLSIGAVAIVAGYWQPAVSAFLLAGGFAVYLAGIIVGARVCEDGNERHD